MKAMNTIYETSIKPEPDFENFKNTLLRKGRPDKIPFYELFVNQPIIEAVLDRKITDVIKDTVEFYYRAGYDYVPVSVNPPLVLGSLVDNSQGYPVNDRESFEKYKWTDVSSIDYSSLEKTIDILPDRMKIVAHTGGIFERAEGICGFENLCYFLADDREMVAEIFSGLAKIYDSMYKTFAGFEDVGAIVISDDMGFKTQTLISPDDLREFVLPQHKKQARIVHDAGKACILHSCGNLSAVMEDIINDVKIDAKHSYEDAILPVTEAYRLYSDRISILGGFDVDRLCRSSLDEVREHTEKIIGECAGNGSYAFGTGNSVTPYVPVSNYLCMLDTARKASTAGGRV